MVKQTEVLAIIQARGGSKGLRNKNLLPLQGHPLIAYSVASALAAAGVTRTIISTDSEAIAEAGRAYGAEAPFRRPASIAADDTPDLPLFQHALDWLWENERYRPDVVVQLRPTTPLRPRGLIDRAISLLESDQKADSVRGVTAPKQTPYKMWQSAEGGYIRQLLDTNLQEPYNQPRQKLPEVLWQTGHIDVTWTRTILQQQSLTGRRVRPIMVDPAYCIDIDTIADFDAAARAMVAEAIDIDRPTSVGTSTSEFKLPAIIDLIVFDFDGVFTDNRVLVFSDGTEAVVCDRGDGQGISQLRRLGIPLVVLSTEVNPVVASRCQKLELEYLQGVNDKLAALRTLSVDRGVSMSNTIFVGNDVNDLPCLKAVGCAVVPADAHAAVIPHADLILTHSGGRGAIRELCDVILKNSYRRKNDAPIA